MKPEYTRKVEFTDDELREIIDSFLEFKPVLDKSPADNPGWWGVDSFLHLLSIYNLADTNYKVNLDKMIEKYDEREIHSLSLEKLDFLEIMTIFTYIPRVDHHDYRNEFVQHCFDDGTYYNLLCRLEEIRNEL